MHCSILEIMNRISCIARVIPKFEDKAILTALENLEEGVFFQSYYTILEKPFPPPFQYLKNIRDGIDGYLFSILILTRLVGAHQIIEEASCPLGQLWHGIPAVYKVLECHDRPKKPVHWVYTTPALSSSPYCHFVLLQSIFITLRLCYSFKHPV